MTQEYIITEEQLERLTAYRKRVLPFMCPDEREDWVKFMTDCESRPYNPQAERERVLDEIIDLVEGRIAGLDNLLATPPEERCESAQDKYLKEARFEQSERAMTPCCYFLHGSNYKCLLRRIEPKWKCEERLKNDNCRLVKGERE